MDLDSEGYGIREWLLFSINGLIAVLAVVVRHLDINSHAYDVRFELDVALYEGNKVLALYCRGLPWQPGGVDESSRLAADESVRSIDSLELNIRVLIPASHFDNSLLKSNVAWSVFVENSDHALSVSALEQLG